MPVPRSYRPVAWLIGGLVALMACPPLALAEEAAAHEPIYQLRIYTLHEPNVGVFHERFRDRAIPIMERYGFDIVAMWETRFENKTEFAYLLRWPDEEVLEHRWIAFLADEEWIAIKQETSAEHGVFVEGIEARTLRFTDYAPRGLDEVR